MWNRQSASFQTSTNENTIPSLNIIYVLMDMVTMK